jgi:hypothetical protein
LIFTGLFNPKSANIVLHNQPLPADIVNTGAGCGGGNLTAIPVNNFSWVPPQVLLV